MRFQQPRHRLRRDALAPAGLVRSVSPVAALRLWFLRFWLLRFWFQCLVLLLTVTMVWACGAPAASSCLDLDGDGRGDGCELGEDCDDTNAARFVACENLPALDCVTAPLATGCPCLPGGVTACYDAPRQSAGVGACREGTVLCNALTETWGLCDGQILPRSERCNGVDDDCDGAIDEQVQSPCGGCNPACVGEAWGSVDAPFVASTDTQVLDDGALTLAPSRRAENATLWVPNTAEGTVSRVDVSTGLESARYFSSRVNPSFAEPSRVAVDHQGDVWVANRYFSGQGTVTEIAGERARCIDSSGDGSLQTSQSANPMLDDECVLAEYAVGEPAEVPRALAIDGQFGPDDVSGGNVWVGLHDAEAVVQISGFDGRVLDRIPTPDFKPYAATFDPWGTLWMIARDGKLASIDPGQTPRVPVIRLAPLRCYTFYSLVSDDLGRLFITGFDCDALTRYEPRNDRWTSVDVSPSPRGIAFARTDEARLLFVAHTGASASLVDADTLTSDWQAPLVGANAPVETIGAAVDVLGAPWFVSTRLDVDARDGLATRIDADGRVTAEVRVGALPHAQGDLTGGALHDGFVAQGEARRVFNGCASEGTTWVALHFDVLPGVTGEVEVQLRHAEDEAALATQAWDVIGTLPDATLPIPLSLPMGGVIELRLRLRTAIFGSAPRVYRAGVEWRCGGPE